MIFAISGLAAGPINPIIGVIAYERIPTNIRARVFGLINAGVLIATPIGALISGYLLDWVGLSVSLAVYGIIYITAVSSLIINPNAGELERPSLPVEARHAPHNNL